MLNGDDWSRVRLNDVSLAQMGWTKRFCNKDLMEEDELVPTRFNTNPSSPCLVISPDKLSAQYSGEGKHGHDVGAAQADCPAPVKRLLYYFEITVKDRGQQGYVSIGFTDRQFKAGRHPGWEQNSFGYHGDDGLVYRGQGKGEQFGFPTFTTGDTVGAGINYAAQEIFFTHNGKFLGSVPKDVIVPLFPTIGLHSLNEKVEVNFGQRSFVYDIELIRSGDIDSAFSKLREWYPRLLQERRSEAAINYARLELQRFYGVGTLEDLLKDAVALLAYEDPKNSDLGYLLSLTQREAVADAVNAMVLSTNPALQNPERVLTSSLEKLLKQLTLCNTMRRDLNGRQGEIFNLHKLLHGAGSTGHALGKS
ncbi:ran-binding protein M homolog isoform X6 [Cryptomeria japonica]|uniref:ran-binding protein M homolog isoform X6 n=1 Tax=Cryptomeria japonica TaxID=3369 RepID=UPI0025AD31B9|nr:ran-binding protein M homolog isoform X6 [Cryptomeria japonica]